MVVGKLEHTRKEPFSLKTRLFPSSLGFFFSQTFCSVFVTLIILTCYFCVYVCVFCVWVCGCCLFVGKIDYDIKKQQFLGEENRFCFSSTLVQYIIIFVFTMLNFHRNTKVHKHYIDLFLFIITVCISLVDVHLYRVEKEDYRDLFAFRFLLFIFIWKLLLFVLCVLVWIYASLSLALCKLQQKLTTWNTCFCVCVFLSLNIAINTTSLGSHTLMSINTDSFLFFLFCNVNIAN